MKKLKITIFVLFLALLVGCNQNSQFSPPEKTGQEETDNTEDLPIEEGEEDIEEEPTQEILVKDYKEIYEIKDFKGITPEMSFLNADVQSQLNEKININWEGRENLEGYKKAYFKEYLKLKTFYETQFNTYEHMGTYPPISPFNLRKAFINDLDLDDTPELVLLFDHPVIEGEESNVLVYTFVEGNENPIPIYRYVSGYYEMGDYHNFLDIGLIDRQGSKILYLVEATDTMHTSETAFGLVNKPYGEATSRTFEGIKRVTNLDFESGDNMDSNYFTTNIFDRYIPTIKDPLFTLEEPVEEESSLERYIALRNEILEKGTLVFNNEKGPEEEGIFYDDYLESGLPHLKQDFPYLSEDELLKTLLE